MSDVEEILRDSIQDKCGMGGLMKFNALYTGGFETTDGKPDLAGISAAVSGTFPADQASAIMDAISRKLEADGHPEKRHRVAHAESQHGEILEVPAAFAKYFNADPNHVRDIVNEARRMRAAMGKATPTQWAPHSDKVIVAAEPEKCAPAEATIAEKVAEIGNAVSGGTNARETATPQPVRPPVVQPGLAAHTEAPLSDLDREIREFAYVTKDCTSIDIMDFIRCLKDKGYSLQEYMVLEKIYVTIEERKREARFAIEKEIEGLIDATQAPGESEIRGLLRRLGEAGLVFEEEDVRRMIRSAVLRRVSLIRRG
jgi:hypothetical protein